MEEKRKILGQAKNFYFVKLLHVSEIEPQQFEWEENVSIFGPSNLPDTNLNEYFEIPIFDVDTRNNIKKFIFKDLWEAKLKFSELRDDLEKMEKSEFEKKIFLMNKEK